MEDLLINTGYTDLLGEIKSRIRTAQYDALRAVNKELISLCWNIGELIVSRQQGETWGIRLSRKWQLTFKRNSPAFRAFRSKTCGA